MIGKSAFAPADPLLLATAIARIRYTLSQMGYGPWSAVWAMQRSRVWVAGTDLREGVRVA